MELLRQLPFIRYAIRVQGLLIAPVDLSGFRIDLKRLFLPDRQPALNLRLLSGCFLLDRNVGKKRFNHGRRQGGSSLARSLLKVRQRVSSPLNLETAM
jgi:hypothetical protein